MLCMFKHAWKNKDFFVIEQDILREQVRKKLEKKICKQALIKVSRLKKVKKFLCEHAGAIVTPE